MSCAADDDSSGIAGNLTAHYPRPIVAELVTLRVLFKMLSIAADIAAMGDSAQRLVGGPEQGRALMFGVLLTAVPVLAGSAADAVAETFGWRDRLWTTRTAKRAASTRSWLAPP